ncbi:Lysophospholipase 1 [Sporothrix bragantina]|uniref:Lysophospholipase n=1 Tax=Sporothrix bragantina TaxID=671064 RepID=A0ABP0CFI8_9PEZI
MNGAGALAAFDSRTPNSTGSGQLGGLLQAATYLSGLSGGSWLVGSLYQQNFTSVDSILYASGKPLSQLWQFNESILEGPATLSTVQYYRQLFDSVQAKEDAGFNTTITDYWGRALSYQLFNATDGGGGAGYTFSSVSNNDTAFASGQAPMPILVAVERPPGQLAILDNSTVFEFNPWEMGSYDPGTAAFAPLRYVGSAFKNGTLPNDKSCMGNVDNVGFVVGTSSSLFNQAFLQISKVEGVPDFLIAAINATLAGLSNGEEDIASWPNPFYRYGNASLNSNSTVLTLVDGGEDLQNIPLHPLILSYREVDVIIAVDSSADTNSHWPNGTSMVATYQRSVDASSTNSSSTEFPTVPDQNTFVNLGLNTRPSFFGCNATDGPLVVYLPNAPYSFLSNVSTFDLEYTNEERDQIVQNGYNVATMGNASIAGDSKWPACLSCAILERSFNRTKTQLPDICVDCFSRYCWNGTVNSTVPAAYEPTLAINDQQASSTSSGTSSSSSTSGGHRRASPAIVCCTAAMMFVASVFL